MAPNAAEEHGPGTPGRGRRRPLGRAVVEMYYRLREREQPPRRVGLSVGLGTLIGCLPLYGLHLALCFGLAKLLRLSGAIAYLAAHVNNPWTAPFLLYVEASVGHRVTSGGWLSVDPRALGEVGLLALGRDLAVGSALVGIGLGGLLAAVSYAISSRWQRSPFRGRFVNRAARRYQELGLRTWEIARYKLRYDPLYLGILGSVALPGGRLVDLGCGRGLLLAAIRAAQELAREGDWPAGWRPPPRRLELVGFEHDPAAARSAGIALAGEASIRAADVREVEIPGCDTIALLDVLHYLGRAEQEDLIGRAVAALEPGGLLLVREADAGGGPRFALTRIQERLSSWLRLEFARRFHYRSAGEWRELLERRGLKVEAEPMDAGTPYSNVLIRARRA